MVCLRSVRIIASGILSVLGCFPGGAFAAEPVAMLMIVNGAISPALPARSQVDEATRVTLQSGASVTFIVFGECGLFTATGGEITFLRREAKIDGGTLERGIGPCTR